MRITILSLKGSAVVGQPSWLELQVLIEPRDVGEPDELLVPADVSWLAEGETLLLGSGFVDLGAVMDVVHVFTRDGRTLEVFRGGRAERPLPARQVGAWSVRAVLHYVPVLPGVEPAAEPEP